MNYQVQVNLKFNAESDADVIQALQASGSPVRYIRYLVRQDIRDQEILNSIDAGKEARHDGAAVKS